ncbi:MAG: hypothetical protein EBW47_12560 [Betaproteobacteria bacterium]|nr:hypothetical protein [Betaproteobacteria bacterium]
MDANAHLHLMHADLECRFPCRGDRARGERHSHGCGGLFDLVTQCLELFEAITALGGGAENLGLNVVRHLTGSYVTSLEMAGCSITVCAVNQEMLELWDAPVQTAALRWGR